MYRPFEPRTTEPTTVTVPLADTVATVAAPERDKLLAVIAVAVTGPVLSAEAVTGPELL